MSPTLHFLSPKDLASLTGAITAVLVVTNGFRQIFGLNPRYVGFACSCILSLVAVLQAPIVGWADCLVAVPNAFIIYFSAGGIVGFADRRQRNALRPTTVPIAPGAPEELAPSRSFWQRWF